MKIALALAVLTMAVAAAASDAKPLLGAWTDVHDVDPTYPTADDTEALKVYVAALPLIEKAFGQSLALATLRSYRTQVVAGTNYVLRVATGTTPAFLHVSLWRKLSGDLLLNKVEGHDSDSDPLTP